jgi:hypothetical protein
MLRVHGFERAVPMLMYRAICSARKAKSLAPPALSFGRKAKRFAGKVQVLCVPGSELGVPSFPLGCPSKKPCEPPLWGRKRT